MLKEQDRDVVVLDSMEFGHRAAVGDVPVIEADIADQESVANAITKYGVDAVLHFAAYKALGESMERPGRYFRNNVSSTASFLETLSRAGVQRFVFSSSCSVYGTPDRVPVAEDAPVQPECPYGAR